MRLCKKNTFFNLIIDKIKYVHFQQCLIKNKFTIDKLELLVVIKKV